MRDIVLGDPTSGGAEGGDVQSDPGVELTGATAYRETMQIKGWKMARAAWSDYFILNPTAYAALVAAAPTMLSYPGQELGHPGTLNPVVEAFKAHPTDITAPYGVRPTKGDAGYHDPVIYHPGIDSSPPPGTSFNVGITKFFFYYVYTGTVGVTREYAHVAGGVYLMSVPYVKDMLCIQ